MRTKLTRFLTITVLALVLGIASAAPVAAQSRPSNGDTELRVVMVVETSDIDKEAGTITFSTTIYYSDGSWEQFTESWPFSD
jgi:hypothetical protein